MLDTSVKATHLHTTYSKAVTWLKRITARLQRAASVPTQVADSLAGNVLILQSVCRGVIQTLSKDTLAAEPKPTLDEVVGSIPKHLLVKDRPQEDHFESAEL